MRDGRSRRGPAPRGPPRRLAPGRRRREVRWPAQGAAFRGAWWRMWLSTPSTPPATAFRTCCIWQAMTAAPGAAISSALPCLLSFSHAARGSGLFYPSPQRTPHPRAAFAIASRYKPRQPAVHMRTEHDVQPSAGQLERTYQLAQLLGMEYSYPRFASHILFPQSRRVFAASRHHPCVLMCHTHAQAPCWRWGHVTAALACAGCSGRCFEEARGTTGRQYRHLRALCFGWRCSGQCLAGWVLCIT